MRIRKVLIRNFKGIRATEFTLDPGYNILVGDNSSGKSCLLEAIHFALRGAIGGVNFSTGIPPGLLHIGTVNDWMAQRTSGKAVDFPVLHVEVTLEIGGSKEAAFKHKGTDNWHMVDDYGVKAVLEFDDRYAGYLENIDGVAFPYEFYKLTWSGYDGNPVNRFEIPKVALFDSARISLASGVDYHVRSLVESLFDEGDKAKLGLAYRLYSDKFMDEQAFSKLVAALRTDDIELIKEKNFELKVSGNLQGGWQSHLDTSLGGIPYARLCGGEQSKLKLSLALSKERDGLDILLLEEPETHLSATSMREMVRHLATAIGDRQLIVATHSAFVANRLGLDNIQMVHAGGQVRSYRSIPQPLVRFFKKRPGYDTLRAILARGCVLVEGPTEDLFVDYFYRNLYGVSPEDHGIDVLAVNGTMAPRFAALRSQIGLRTVVIIDNDGDPNSALERYSSTASGPDNLMSVHVERDSSLPTFEPSFVAVNHSDDVRDVVVQGATTSSAVEFMLNNKVESAMRIVESDKTFKPPKYVAEALQELHSMFSCG